ncbi:hypothetical protein IM538_04085 [Cytobacillus suaedae]|nr:hypothetical protein IM538_04085 [Cytobacillus suaedae]
MKRRNVLTFCIVFILVTFSLFPSHSIATKWVYSFVVWDGYVYVVSDEYVTEIGSEIGYVTNYSDMEELPGNFSNKYKEGTKYYSIKGVNTGESIAIEEGEDRFKKADREKEYHIYKEDSHEEQKFTFNDFGIGLSIGLSVLLLIIVIGSFFVKKKNIN